ncbi:flippase [bacterium]|nr:flippase [bacterium]
MEKNIPRIKQISKNVIYKVLSHIIAGGFFWLFIVVVIRHLGDVEYGKYAFAFAFVEIFMFLAELGFTTVVIKNIARDKKVASNYLGNVITIKLFLSVLVYALIVLVINFISVPSSTRLAVYIAGFIVIIKTFNEVFKGVFNAYERFDYAALVSIINRAIMFVLVWGVLLYGYRIFGVLTMQLAAIVLASTFTFFLVFKNFIRPRLEINLPFWKSLLKEAFPIGITSMFMIIFFRIDTVMLSFMRGDAEVGWYNAAYRPFEVLIFIPLAITAVFFPVFSDYSKNSLDNLKRAYRESFRFLLFLGIPFAMGGAVLSGKKISFLFTPDFLNSISALRILIWAIAFLFLSINIMYVLISLDKQHLNAYNALFCVLLNIGLNLVFIARWGYLGAAMATVITQMVFFGIGFWLISKYFYRISLLKIIWKPILSGIIMSSILYYLQVWNLFILIIIGVVIYFILLCISKAFTEEDKVLFRKIIN